MAAPLPAAPRWPQVPRWLTLRQSLRMARDPVGNLNQLLATHGDTGHLYLGSVQPTSVTRDPALVQRYLPFGGGPRLCVGTHFALTELQLVLLQTLRRYRVRPAAARPELPRDPAAGWRAAPVV